MTRLGAQRGFSLIAAVFLITAAAVIAAAMAHLLTARSRTTVQNIHAAQAFYAAQSGLEIGIARALSGGCSGFPLSLDLDGYAVTVTCGADGVDEAGAAYAVYALDARARRGTVESSSLVSRRVAARVTAGPP